MSRSFRVAVVGATGLVGETMIRILEERARQPDAVQEQGSADQAQTAQAVA